LNLARDLLVELAAALPVTAIPLAVDPTYNVKTDADGPYGYSCNYGGIENERGNLLHGIGVAR